MFETKSPMVLAAYTRGVVGLYLQILKSECVCGNARRSVTQLCEDGASTITLIELNI